MPYTTSVNMASYGLTYPQKSPTPRRRDGWERKDWWWGAILWYLW